MNFLFSPQIHGRVFLPGIVLLRTALRLKELSKIEPILEKAIIEHNGGLEKDSRRRLELEGYKRQYVAILNEKGEKEI